MSSWAAEPVITITLEEADGHRGTEALDLSHEMMAGSCPKQNPSRLRRSYSLMLSHSHHHQSFHVNKLCTRFPLPSPFCEAAISVVIHSSGNQIVPRLQPRTRVLFLTESGDKAVLRLWTHSLFSVCRGKALTTQSPSELEEGGVRRGCLIFLRMKD